MSLFEHLHGIVFPVLLGLYRNNDNKNFFFDLLINILIKLDNILVYMLRIDSSGLFPVLGVLQWLTEDIINFRKDSSIHVITMLMMFIVYPAILLCIELLPGNTENLLCNFSISFESQCWKSQLQDYFLFSVVYYLSVSVPNAEKCSSIFRSFD